MDNLKLTEQLKRRRLALGLSQAEVASRAGIEQSQVSKLERGLDVRLSTLTKLLLALDLDITLAARPRPGGEAQGQMPIPHPHKRPSGRAYAIPGTNEWFVPATGSLLDRFGISDEDGDHPVENAARRKR